MSRQTQTSSGQTTQQPIDDSEQLQGSSRRSLLLHNVLANNQAGTSTGSGGLPPITTPCAGRSVVRAVSTRGRAGLALLLGVGSLWLPWHGASGVAGRAAEKVD